MVQKDRQIKFYYLGQFDILEVKPAKKLNQKGKEQDIAKFRVKMKSSSRRHMAIFFK